MTIGFGTVSLIDRASSLDLVYTEFVPCNAIRAKLFDLFYLRTALPKLSCGFWGELGNGTRAVNYVIMEFIF